MDLGSALWEELANRPVAGRVSDWATALGFYSRRAENASEAARDAGVPVSTWRRWLKGAIPRANRAASIVAAARSSQARGRLSHRREQRYRDSTDLVVKGRWQYAPGQPRHVGLGSYLVEGWADAVVDAFLAGGSPAELHETLHGFIYGSQWYEQTFDPRAPAGSGWDVTAIEWE